MDRAASPASALDLTAIAARVGYQDPCWELSPFACPHCERIYLFEAELSEVWLDPDDLTRTAVVSAIEPFACLGCGRAVQMERGQPVGVGVPPDGSALRASGWAWACSG